MSRLSQRTCALAIGLIIAAAAIYTATRAVGQIGPGWVSLFDGTPSVANGTALVRPTGGSRTA